MAFSNNHNNNKFGHRKKWYMHNGEAVLENEKHKILWDFGIKRII